MCNRELRPPEIPLEVDATTTTGSGVPEVLPTGDVANDGVGAATTGDGDDNSNGDGDGGELEVIMGHPNLRAPGHISLPEAMGTAHFALRVGRAATRAGRH
jgi:hypothetical protein